MKTNKADILDDLQDLQYQADRIGFAGNHANDLWRRELIAEYIVNKLTISNENESLVCNIYGCVNTLNKDKHLCDEHLID